MPWTEPLDQADPTRISWLVYRTYLRSILQSLKLFVRALCARTCIMRFLHMSHVCVVGLGKLLPSLWLDHFSMHPSSLDAASPAQLLLGQTRFAWSRFDPFDWKTWWTTRLSMQSCLIARRLHRRRTTVLGPTHFKGFTFSGTI